jgi:hypothetical protein
MGEVRENQSILITCVHIYIFIETY